MEWKGKWNGTEISVWNMEDAWMEWNGRFQERNGRQFPYFHTNSKPDFVHCIYRKIHTDVGWWYIILSQKYSTSISSHIICRQIAVLWLFILRKQRTYCIIISTLQSAALIVDDLNRFDLFFCFFLRLRICQVLNFVFLHRHENSHLLFHSCFSLILFIFLVFQLT